MQRPALRLTAEFDQPENILRAVGLDAAVAGGDCHDN